MAEVPTLKNVYFKVNCWGRAIVLLHRSQIPATISPAENKTIPACVFRGILFAQQTVKSRKPKKNQGRGELILPKTLGANSHLLFLPLPLRILRKYQVVGWYLPTPLRRRCLRGHSSIGGTGGEVGGKWVAGEDGEGVKVPEMFE